MSRFDYVRYDDEHTALQNHARHQVENLEAGIECLPASREKSLALTKLEECYMWIGKAIRNKQIAEGGSSKDVPSRG